MLIGEYQHSVDVKGRVNFPSKLRESLGDSFIITKGYSECLFVYSMEEWKQMESRIRALPDTESIGIRRFLFAGATQADIDKQGRIIIPQKLREFAHITKDIMVVGVMDRAEIWDLQRWEESAENLSPSDIFDNMKSMSI